jgi:hypothetical protein
MTESHLSPVGLTSEELDAEGGTALPDKEVVSLLDLNVDLNLALDLAAPIDLAVAANANVAAPIDAAVSANVLSFGSHGAAAAPQDVAIHQDLTGEAHAHGDQLSDIDQAGGTEPAPAPAPAPTPAPDPVSEGGILDGDLLHVDVKGALDSHIAAPIAGAVAANANVAAPIDAAASANVLSINSEAIGVADQHAVIDQNLDAVADAGVDQDSTIAQ